jgi:ATP-dependent DNA ligase
MSAAPLKLHVEAVLKIVAVGFRARMSAAPLKLEERREQLREAIKHLPDTIRYSEIFSVPLAALMRAVREHQLEEIVAKRAGSQYRSGKRCGEWLKWQANRGQEFVIGGYVPSDNLLDSILIGYYDGRDLVYGGRIRAGLSTEFRRVLLRGRGPEIISKTVRPFGLRYTYYDEGTALFADPPLLGEIANARKYIATWAGHLRARSRHHHSTPQPNPKSGPPHRS